MQIGHLQDKLSQWAEDVQTFTRISLKEFVASIIELGECYILKVSVSNGLKKSKALEARGLPSNLAVVIDGIHATWSPLSPPSGFPHS